MSSRKLEITREHFMQNEHNKGQKWYGPISDAGNIMKRWQEYTEE